MQITLHYIEQIKNNDKDIFLCFMWLPIGVSATLIGVATSRNLPDKSVITMWLTVFFVRFFGT